MIAGITLPTIPIGDEILWTASDDGQFSISSEINTTHNGMVEPDWANTIWFPGCIKGHSTIAWFFFASDLKTKSSAG